MDRLALDAGRIVGDRRRGALDRRAARPRGRGDRRPPARQRARRAQGARAARRHRRGLRGAAERDRRRRRAVPEVGQRDRAARLVARRRTPTPCSPRSSPPEFPDGAVSLVSGGREELAELAGQEGVVDLIIPRGGEGLKKALSAVAQGAGDLRGRRATATSTWMRAPTSTTRCGSSSTPRRSAPASATPPRRCSCTATSRRQFLPAARHRAARRGRRAARGRARGRAARRRRRRPPTRTSPRSSWR